MQKKKKLLIVGAGGHGKVIADIAIQLGEYQKIAFLDDNTNIISVIGCEREGTMEHLNLESRDTEVFVAVGNSKVRQTLCNQVKELGFSMPTLIHPHAVVANDVFIGKGTVVMAGVVINSGVKLGEGVIVNTSSSVDHDCEVGDFSHIAVGAHVAGTVLIGSHAWIGAGAVVSNNVTIVDNVMIGAGAVVVKNVEETGTYIGVPAKKIK